MREQCDAQISALAWSRVNQRCSNAARSVNQRWSNAALERRAQRESKMVERRAHFFGEGRRGHWQHTTAAGRELEARVGEDRVRKWDRDHSRDIRLAPDMK